MILIDRNKKDLEAGFKFNFMKDKSKLRRNRVITTKNIIKKKIKFSNYDK